MTWDSKFGVWVVVTGVDVGMGLEVGSGVGVVVATDFDTTVTAILALVTPPEVTLRVWTPSVADVGIVTFMVKRPVELACVYGIPVREPSHRAYSYSESGNPTPSRRRAAPGWPLVGE